MLRGCYRDQIIGPDGRIRHDSGLHANQIVRSGGLLILGLLRGDAGAGPIGWLAYGRGRPEAPEGWRAPSTTSRLLDEVGRHPVRLENMRYLDARGELTDQPTGRLRVQVTLKIRADLTLREFGLLGGAATAAADSGTLLNHVHHAPLQVRRGEALLRTIILSYEALATPSAEIELPVEEDSGASLTTSTPISVLAARPRTLPSSEAVASSTPDPVTSPSAEPAVVEIPAVEVVTVAPAVVEPAIVVPPTQPSVEVNFSEIRAAGRAVLESTSDAAPSATAAVTPTPEPVVVAAPTPEPVVVAVAAPTPEPVVVAVAAPTPEPVAAPTPEPVAAPTPEPVVVVATPTTTTAAITASSALMAMMLAEPTTRLEEVGAATASWLQSTYGINTISELVSYAGPVDYTVALYRSKARLLLRLASRFVAPPDLAGWTVKAVAEAGPAAIAATAGISAADALIVHEQATLFLMWKPDAESPLKLGAMIARPWVRAGARWSPPVATSALAAVPLTELRGISSTVRYVASRLGLLTIGQLSTCEDLWGDAAQLLQKTYVKELYSVPLWRAKVRMLLGVAEDAQIASSMVGRTVPSLVTQARATIGAELQLSETAMDSLQEKLGLFLLLGVVTRGTLKVEGVIDDVLSA